METVAHNRRARFDYEIVDTIEAGIVLTGQEVKSARLKQVNLGGSFVTMLQGVPTIRHLKIAPYRYASGLASYDPGRDRLLLLKRADIDRLTSSQAEKGMTIVPLEVRAGHHIKVLLGLAKGRKRHDKRAVLRERDIEKRLRSGRGE